MCFYAHFHNCMASGCDAFILNIGLPDGQRMGRRVHATIFRKNRKTMEVKIRES